MRGGSLFSLLLIVQDEMQVRSASWKQPSHRVPNTIFTRSAKYHRNRDHPLACVSNRGLSCSDFVTASESLNYACNSYKSASMDKQWCKTDDHPSATQLGGWANLAWVGVIMSFIPASQITAGSGEYLHAHLRIGSATQQKYADMAKKKRRGFYKPKEHVASLFQIQLTFTRSVVLRWKQLKNRDTSSQESSNNGQITCQEIFLGGRGGGILKVLVCFSCRLMFNVISKAEEHLSQKMNHIWLRHGNLLSRCCLTRGLISPLKSNISCDEKWIQISGQRWQIPAPASTPMNEESRSPVTRQTSGVTSCGTTAVWRGLNNSPSVLAHLAFLFSASDHSLSHILPCLPACLPSTGPQLPMISPGPEH